MTSKTARKYELIAKIATSDTDFAAHIRELCDIDFDTAFDMWEFALARGANVTHNAAAQNASSPVATAGLHQFLSDSETKTRTLFCDSIPLQRALYNNAEAAAPACIEFLASLILSNKLEAADECLTKLRGNTHIDFNDAMRSVQESAFAQNCKKNNSKIPVFNKKQKTLLLDHINKIKGPNRALLLQRMKEI